MGRRISGSSTRASAARIAPYAPLAIILVLFLLPGAAAVLFTVADALFTLVGGDSLLAAVGQDQFISLLR